MELKSIIFCLNSETRRRILQLLSKRDMSAPQIFEELGTHAPKYRQSINKTLETMRNCGLVAKYYDNEKRGIYYHLIAKSIILEIDKLKVGPFEAQKRQEDRVKL